MDELIVRIKALLGRKQSSNSSANEKPIFQLGQYSFDFNKQILQFQSNEKQLTHREAELLKLFCENKNSVLDRQATLQKLWGDDSFFNARSMDVFITKLRKYLKNDSSIQIINVRGVGYKIIY